MDAKGSPGVTQRAWILPPASRMGPATDAERQLIRNLSGFAGKYDTLIDRESAFEVLTRRAEEKNAQAAARAQPEDEGIWGAVKEMMIGSTGPRGGRKDGVIQQVAKGMVRDTARKMLRGVLGSLIGKSGKR